MFSLNTVFGDPLLLIVTVLTAGVVLVNGWTDAPNAIATCVSTRAVSPRSAVLMASVYNCAGVLCATAVNASVAFTVRGMVDLGDSPRIATAALCAALCGVIVWAVAAWCFGIPTSESHALIAGLSGAALAIRGGGICYSEWGKVLYGLVISVLGSAVAGVVFTRLTERLCRRCERLKAQRFFKNAQVAAAALTAFMHGAQDGQKFIGILLLGLGHDGKNIPLWLPLLCSLVLSLGTSLGGYRIIKAVGMDMVTLTPHQGFCADISASVCLFGCTLFGIPVSTTHTKTAAVMGCGASRRLSAVRFSVVRDILLTWVLTFPACGLIGYFTARLFLWGA